MDIIQLPAVPILTPPRVALALMRATGRSGVVAAGPQELMLVSSSDIRLAINRELTSLSDLTGVEPIAFAPVELPQLGPDLFRISPLGRPHGRLNMTSFGSLNLDGIIARTLGDYAVIGYGPGVAYVLTRYETRAELYANPPLRCACGNPQYVHEYGESDGVSSGQPCRRCSYTISCD